MGLLAAIPAVIFYNHFVNEIGRYTNRLEAFADEFSAILSRQLDEKARADGRGACTTSRSRGRRRRSAAPMAEINVTPFVDVMLVLLIVFMVTAPLLTVGVPVDLPKTKAQALGQDREPLSVTDRARRQASICRTRRSPRTHLVPKLHGDFRQRLRPAHLRARRQVRRLWPRHGSDGPDSARRLHPYRARYRCRKAEARAEIGCSPQRSQRRPRRGVRALGLIVRCAAACRASIAATLFTWSRIARHRRRKRRRVPVDLVTDRRQDQYRADGRAPQPQAPPKTIETPQPQPMEPPPLPQSEQAEPAPVPPLPDRSSPSRRRTRPWTRRSRRDQPTPRNRFDSTISRRCSTS